MASSRHELVMCWSPVATHPMGRPAGDGLVAVVPSSRLCYDGCTQYLQLLSLDTTGEVLWWPANLHPFCALPGALTMKISMVNPHVPAHMMSWGGSLARPDRARAASR